MIWFLSEMDAGPSILEQELSALALFSEEDFALRSRTILVFSEFGYEPYLLRPVLLAAFLKPFIIPEQAELQQYLKDPYQQKDPLHYSHSPRSQSQNGNWIGYP